MRFQVLFAAFVGFGCVSMALGSMEGRKKRHHIGHTLRLPQFNDVRFSENAAAAALATHSGLPTQYARPTDHVPLSRAQLSKTLPLSEARFAAVTTNTAQLTAELEEKLRTQASEQARTEAMLQSLTHTGKTVAERGSSRPPLVGSNMKFKSLTTAQQVLHFGAVAAAGSESENAPVDWVNKEGGKSIQEQFVPWGKHIPRKAGVTYFVATGYQECAQCRRIIGSSYDYGKNYPELCAEASSGVYRPMCLAQTKVLQACPEFTNSWCYQDYGGTQVLRSPCPDALVCHYCLGMNPLHCVDNSFGGARGM